MGKVIARPRVVVKAGTLMADVESLLDDSSG
jgi:hypothetical protein